MMNSRERQRSYNSIPSSASSDELFEVRPRQYIWHLPFRIPWRFVRLNTASIMFLSVLSVIISGFLQYFSVHIRLPLVVGILQSVWFLTFCVVEYKRMRLYTHGAAVEAKATFCGLRDMRELRDDNAEVGQRFAWVVEWSYTVKQVTVHNRTSMHRMRHICTGEKFWVLVDRKNPRFGIRWELFSREGLVNDGIIDSDTILGFIFEDDDPRLEHSLIT